MWCPSKKHFAELVPQNGEKTAGINMTWRNYVTVTLCIGVRFSSSPGSLFHRESTTFAGKGLRNWGILEATVCARRTGARFRSILCGRVVSSTPNLRPANIYVRLSVDRQVASNVCVGYVSTLDPNFCIALNKARFCRVKPNSITLSS